MPVRSLQKTTRTTTNPERLQIIMTAPEYTARQNPLPQGDAD